MNTRPQAALPYVDLAKQAARITRRIELGALSRLEALNVEEVIRHSDVFLDVSLQFSQGSAEGVRVRGEISGDLGLVCNGCAEALPFHVAIDFDCLIVASDEVARQVDARSAGDGSPEALIVADGREISLTQIVEDEILLGLPERLCRSEPCERAPRLFYPADDVGAEPAPEIETDNPFSVLADLTKTKRTPTE